MTESERSSSRFSEWSESDLRILKAKLANDLTRSTRRNRLKQFYPDTGPLRRELYGKHIEFFRLGAEHRERCFLAANRVGKTIVGGYETALHLTGLYPEWWEGRRFATAGDWWAAGNTSETTRDIVQLELLGPSGDFGTGFIPYDCILREPSAKRGVTNAVDTVDVRHISGGTSTLGFKSYDQGREKFQGVAKHGIWLDEECDDGVYDECLLRLMTTDGLMLVTFTPLKGLSPVVLRFMPGMAPEEQEPAKPW